MTIDRYAQRTLTKLFIFDYFFNLVIFPMRGGIVLLRNPPEQNGFCEVKIYILFYFNYFYKPPSGGGGYTVTISFDCVPRDLFCCQVSQLCLVCKYLMDFNPQIYSRRHFLFLNSRLLLHFLHSIFTMCNTTITHTSHT